MRLPIIATSADISDDAGLPPRCLAAGMNAFVAKPWDMERLVDVVLCFALKRVTTAAPEG